MKKFLLLFFFCSFSTLSIFAQTQSGCFRTNGRYGKPGRPINDVFVKANGPYNSVLSDSEGKFSITFDGKTDGDAYSLMIIKKNGYELLDKGLINRKLGLTTNVPIEIVMVDQAQMRAEKEKIADALQARYYEEYMKKGQLLQSRYDSLKLSKDEMQKEYEKLDKAYVAMLERIDELSDKYARTDYDVLSELDKTISQQMELGNFDAAMRLLAEKGDDDERIRAQLDDEEKQSKNRRQLDSLNNEADKVDSGLSANRKNIESDLLKKFELYKSQYRFQEAQSYIEKLMRFEPENPEYPYIAGCFAQEELATDSLAHKYFVQSLTLREKNCPNDYAGIVKSKLKIGFENSNPEEWYNNLEEYCLSHKVDSCSLASLYSSWGNYLFHVGMEQPYYRPLSEKYYKKAMSFWPNNNAKYHVGIVSTLLDMGQNYVFMHRFEDALATYNDALAIIASGCNTKQTPYAKYLIANVEYQYHNDLKKAKELYRQAGEENERIFGPSFPGNCGIYCNLGCLALDEKNEEEAIYYFNLSAETLRRSIRNGNNSEGSLAFVFANIAEIYLDNGKIEEAISIFDEVAGKTDEARMHEILCRAYEKQGRIEEAEKEWLLYIKHKQRDFIKKNKDNEIVKLAFRHHWPTTGNIFKPEK